MFALKSISNEDEAVQEPLNKVSKDEKALQEEILVYLEKAKQRLKNTYIKPYLSNPK